MKRKIYFLQVNYSYGKAAHIPYTAGQISAYAFADSAVAENYSLERIFFLRESVDRILEKIDNPSVVAFSTYIWNCNFNKEVAKRIKEKYPDCAIIFGGHHVAPGGGMLEECPYIDYLLHGEGEVIFRRLLRALIGLEDASEIPGISMRTANGILTNPEMISTECDFPSPYTGGYFDTILAENPDKEFMALIETSRGCPNSCAYCDWSSMKSKIRKFPLERVYGDIDWISSHKIYGLGGGDSNFGMFSRDSEITDKIVEAKKKTGYPVKFQTSYEKNSSKNVFDIGMKLEKNGLSKGITLSFQSMNDEVLKNIGRQNISTEFFSELMRLYNEAGVATYTELILGLPGETKDSLVDSIDKLLELGQHNAIYIHNCEWLPCAIMGQKDYVEKYKIGISHIPLNQPHREADDVEEIPEESSIVTSTYSMTTDDWKKMNIFSAVVQACHHMGILEFFALYLYNEGLSTYKNFYCSFIDNFYNKTETVAGRTIAVIEKQLDAVLSETGTPTVCDNRFGKVLWLLEEYVFLSFTYDAEIFYAEVREFLLGFGIDNGIFEALMHFQKNIIRQPFSEETLFVSDYDFISYFEKCIDGDKAVLKKEKNTVYLDAQRYDSWERFARITAWFSRKEGTVTHFKQAILKRRSSENGQ